ncbi:unnamed protein product [Rotaria sp. Silwood1]|nr:unnamed protein product [Rotaria sp. Silwood1]
MDRGVNRFRCPKGWKRLGGSCYYFPSFTSTSITANYTCNHLHSNLSNLLQIRNVVELVYAAHVLTRNNLSSLMLSIDPKFLKGKNLTEMLTNDQERWKRTKEKAHKMRIKYLNLTTKVVERLKLVGLYMLRRSKKIKQSSEQYTQHETAINTSLMINDNDNEYEYDDLNSSDESDEFEQIDDIHGICNQIAWNALNDSSTVYILTTYIISDKIVCSLSDVESNTEYHHICEYVLDSCFANIICGKHGYCVNTPPRKLLSPIKRDLVRNIWVGLLSTCFLSILIIVIPIKYYKLYEIDRINDKTYNYSLTNTIHLVRQCEETLDYLNENKKFFPFAFFLIFIFSWFIKREKKSLIKREKKWLNKCGDRPGLLSPIEPFRIENRFTTATVFGIIAYGVLKIFEGLLFGLNQTLNHGVLFEVLIRIGIIVALGLRYYPVLASLQLRNIFVRFFACLYILCEILYTIVREGSCMGFLQLTKKHAVVEEAKLRVELGTWFIIYGLIKNIPHFFFLSYIGAELCVRFVYDSIYVPIKNKKNILLTPDLEFDELKFAQYYVTKLLRRNCPAYRTNTKKTTNINNQTAHEYQSKQQNINNQSCIKKCFNYFYHWDDDFHFTTIATCTYTVAFVFLYYITCTFIFLYLSRASGLISLIRSYIEHSANVELNDSFTLKYEIISSAILTAIIYGFQLLIGMQYYKKHKQDLYKGMSMDIPLPRNISWDSMVSHSVHYAGFLVGYMAWGFVICFHFIFLILIGIRIISLQSHPVELGLGIIVPILVIYLLKMLMMTSIGKIIFTKHSKDIDDMKNPKTYAIFVYFSFFADCFLGIASCIIRLLKATFLNVAFMARIDYSFLGRPLEKFDVGFDAYVSYLYVEKQYSNALVLVFCDILWNEIKKKRSNNVNHSHDENGSRKKRENQYDTSIQNINHNTTNDQLCSSIENINSRTKLQNISTTSNETSKTIDSRKRKSQKFPTLNDEIHIDKDDSSLKPLIISSTFQKQAQLSKSSTNRTKILNNESRRSKQDQSENLTLKPFSTTEKSLLQKKSNKKKISKQTMVDISDSSIVEENDDNEDTDNQIVEEDLPINDTLVNINRSFKHQQDTTSIPFNTNDRLAPKISNTTQNTNSRKSTEKYHQDTVLTEAKDATICATTINPLSSNSQRSCTNSLAYLRTNSNNAAQQRSLEHVPKRPKSSFSKNHESNRNNDDNYDIETTNNRIQTEISSCSHSPKESIPLICNHSNRQLSERIQIKQSNTIEEDKKRKSQIARIRWFRAYTIIHNYHLFDLRQLLKNFSYSQQNQPIDEQISRSTTTDENIESTTVPQSRQLVTQRSKGNTCESQSPIFNRFLSLSTIEECPTSPAEQYISRVVSQLILADSQSLASSKRTNVSPQENTHSPSLGFSPTSAESTYQYSSGISKNTNLSKLRKQMSHDQHMQVWYEDEIKKFQKNRPHSYLYGLPPNYHEKREFHQNALLKQKPFFKNEE